MKNWSQSISDLLKKYNLRPRKGLGQNFLVDPVHLSKIVEAAELSPADIVLEIGPGPGTLTRLLAETAGQVIAVELDPQMVHLLQNELGHLGNLHIIKADILQTFLPDLIPPPDQSSSPEPLRPTPNPKSPISTPQSPRSAPSPQPPAYKVVANLPYYITSAVLRHLLESTPRPRRIVVTVQKEVAQRIVAGPGEMSVLAVSVQLYGRPAIMHHIPAGAFYPPPKVDSAVVRIDTFSEPDVPVRDIDFFFQVVKAGFSQKRKQLKNSLAAGLRKPASAVVEAMAEANIDPTRRAETLSLAEWARLAQVIES